MKYCSIFVLSFVVVTPTYTAELAPAGDAAYIDGIFLSGQRNRFCVGHDSNRFELVLLKTVCTIPAGEEQPPDLVDQAWSTGPGLGNNRTVAATFGSLVKIWSTKSNSTNNFKLVHAINTGIEDIHTLQLKVPASRLLVSGNSIIQVHHIKNKHRVIQSYDFKNNAIHHIDTDNALKKICILLSDDTWYTMQEVGKARYELYDPHQKQVVWFDGQHHINPDNGDGKSDEEEHSNQDDQDDKDNDDDNSIYEPGSPPWHRMLRSRSQPVISSSSNALQELETLRANNAQLRDQVAQLEQLSQEQATRIEELQKYKQYFEQKLELIRIQKQLLQAQAQLTQLRKQQ